MENLKYSDILSLNNELGKSLKGKNYEIAVLSNIVTHQINDILEYILRKENINAKVRSGDYDNIVQDSIKFAGSDLIIIFWEVSNLISGLHYKSNLLNNDELDLVISKAKSEIDFTLSNLKNTSLVIFNKFSSLIFNHNNIKSNNLDLICERLNEYLEKNISSNVILINTDKIFTKIPVAKGTDFRYFYSSKALYSIDFYKEYALFVHPIINSVKGQTKKALIFDCDNTLWKGILGEDGADNIEMSAKTKNGSIFQEVQCLTLELASKGILIGLCSKNNQDDVENIINSHPDMSLRNEFITIKKVNWDNKVTNLKQIAKELNIGLDSIVFVDDSDFEIGFIKEKLPGVTVLKVPENIYEYPSMMRKHCSLFFSVSETKEDKIRTAMYKDQVKRLNEKESFENIEGYLASLELMITMHINKKNTIPRIAQMTQKTNQFNLTTKRYTETDIENFINNAEYTTCVIEVQDKYGDSGITGVVIVKREGDSGEKALIDTFLMSCRIIGRNIEFAIFDFMVKYLTDTGVRFLETKYIKTIKNEQVSDFYEKLNLKCVHRSENEKTYQLKLMDYEFKNINYIKLNYERKN